jgi:hypothetical protein
MVKAAGHGPDNNPAKALNGMASRCVLTKQQVRSGRLGQRYQPISQQLHYPRYGAK